MQNINDFESKFKPPTTTFQVQGRVAAICVILAVILVVAIVLVVLCWKLKHPAASLYLIAILFFFVCLVFLVGSSVIRALVDLANDGCLYAETFVTTVILNAIDDPTEQAWLKRALKFYLNPNPPNPNVAESAISEIAGVNLVPILDAIQSPLVGTLLGLLDAGFVQTALRFVLQDATVTAINDLVDIVQPLTSTSEYLDDVILLN